MVNFWGRKIQVKQFQKTKQTNFEEIIPDKRGRCYPGSVYLVKCSNNVISVKVKLEEYFLGQE